MKKLLIFIVVLLSLIFSVNADLLVNQTQQNNKRFYYNTYKTKEKALKVAMIYKKSDNCHYSIVEHTTPIFLAKEYHLYLTKISPLSNGLVFV